MKAITANKRVGRRSWWISYINFFFLKKKLDLKTQIAPGRGQASQQRAWLMVMERRRLSEGNGNNQSLWSCRDLTLEELKKKGKELDIKQKKKRRKRGKRSIPPPLETLMRKWKTLVRRLETSQRRWIYRKKVKSLSRCSLRALSVTSNSSWGKYVNGW
jgi:hypothetical protein